MAQRRIDSKNCLPHLHCRVQRDLQRRCLPRFLHKCGCVTFSCPYLAVVVAESWIISVFANLYYEFNNELLGFVFSEHSNLMLRTLRRHSYRCREDQLWWTTRPQDLERTFRIVGGGPFRLWKILEILTGLNLSSAPRMEPTTEPAWITKSSSVLT